MCLKQKHTLYRPQPYLTAVLGLTKGSQESFYSSPSQILCLNFL